MPEAAYTSAMTEAVAVFHDVTPFQAAIDELLTAGFDHADINVLAHEDTVTSKLGSTYRSTAEFEDNPEAPRIGYIPDETIGNAEGAVIGAGVYVPAMVGSLAVAASGGTLLGAGRARLLLRQLLRARWAGGRPPLPRLAGRLVARRGPRRHHLVDIADQLAERRGRAAPRARGDVVGLQGEERLTARTARPASASRGRSPPARAPVPRARPGTATPWRA